MSNVETGRASANEAEVVALNARIARQLRDRAPLDARAVPQPPASAALEPEAASAQDWSWLPPDSAAHQYKDQTLKTIIAFLEPFQETIENLADAIAKLRKGNMELKLELAELKGQLAETRSKADTTDFVVQRLRLENKGDVGPAGPMGRDGKDGVQGPRGEKGGRGQRGFETTGWLINEAEYCITPLFYDNSQGPTLNLRGLFEQFNRDTEGDDVALATEQLALSRASLELEVERTRRGLPAK